MAYTTRPGTFMWNRRFLHHHTFAQTSISQCLQTDLLCTPSAIVLFHCCVNHTLFQGSLWHALDCYHLHNSEKWFFMRQGIQSCLCKEMLAENCTAQNEAWCRLSAGQQESTEPQPAVRLAYEETLRLCALLLKVRALLTFWMSLVKVLSLSHFFYNVFLNKAAFI